jgi:hypothetical protein
MRRANPFTFALVVAEALLVGALLRVDYGAPILPRSPASEPMQRGELGCRVDPLTPAPWPSGGQVPHVASPSENARIYEAALAFLFDRPDVLDETSVGADEIWLASESQVRMFRSYVSLECEVATWRQVMSVSGDTLRAFLRDNLRPVPVPISLVASPRGRSMRLTSMSNAGLTCGPVVVLLSNPGINPELREAVVRVTVRRNGSGGEFLVALRQRGARWRGVDVERLSFIDGSCDQPPTHQ